MTDKIRTSPNFALTTSADGRCYVMREVEPYTQFWLSERERMIFALCARRGGAAVGAVLRTLAAMGNGSDSAREARLTQKAIGEMVAAGVLLQQGADLSRYDKGMAADYLAHRPFPATIARRIVDLAGIGPETRVLDMAAGPGSLALELAQATPLVAMMELSRGFVAAAHDEAQRRGLPLETIHESCNRLPHHDAQYDVMTISQAIHWLDDIQLCKGVCRNLAPGGSLFVVHGCLTLSDDHPLSYILGDRTPLGDKQQCSFPDEVRPLYRRLSTLFDALDAPDVARHDPGHARQAGAAIEGVGIDLFDQVRPIGEGFARAFLSGDHIAQLGQDPAEFWRDLRARCEGADPARMLGKQEWALLHFRRGGPRMEPRDWAPQTPFVFGFPG